MSNLTTTTTTSPGLPLNNGGISMEYNVLSALKQPPIQRCHALSAVIQDALNTNTKEIQNYFPLIIENIFNYGNQMSGTGWNLRTISRSQDPQTFDAIYSFLHPNGALFALIKHVMFDPTFKCFFPLDCLPLPTKMTIDKGIVPEFYVNKIVTDAYSQKQGKILLNALEFYLMHFSYYIRDERLKEPYLIDYLNGGSNPSTILYISLLEIYLKVFLPLDVNQINARTNESPLGQQSNHSLWKSLSSTTSNLLHLGSSGSPLSPNATGNQQSSMFPKSTLLNLRPFINASNTETSYFMQNTSQEQRVIHNLGSVTWKAETVLHIFAEMYLNIYHPSISSKPSSVNYMNPIVTPNADHVRCVRVLVKHLHYFCNSAFNLPGQGFLNSTGGVSELDNIKRSVFTNRYPVQKRLYCFIRWCFDHWPLDGSFRLPMETWLSYIQPWRYVESSNSESHASSVKGDDSPGNSSSSNLFETSQRWKTFISENLLFYTVVFYQSLERFSRLDLTSSKNSLMLARMTKIICQPALLNLLRECEESLENLCSPNSFNWSASRGSLLNPHLRSPTSSQNQTLSYRHHLEMECEASDFVYVPISSSRTRSELERLLLEVMKAHREVKQSMEQLMKEHNKESSQGFWGSFMSMFMDDANTFDYKQLIADKQKTECHLSAIMSRLVDTFGLSIPDLDNGFSSQSQSSNGAASKAEMVYDENGLAKLSEVGRYQILNKLREPNVTYQGNPDTQPVKSYEIAFLVSFLITLSRILNERYGRRLELLYNRQDIIGFFMSLLLAPPTTYVKVEKTADSILPKRKTEHLPPRINLRFLARKKLIFYLVLFYFVAKLLTTLQLLFVFSLFVAFLIYGTYKKAQEKKIK